LLKGTNTGGDTAKIIEECKTERQGSQEELQKRQAAIDQSLDQCKASEETEVGNTKVLYQIVKELAGSNGHRSPIKQKDVKVCDHA